VLPLQQQWGSLSSSPAAPRPHRPANCTPPTTASSPALLRISFSGVTIALTSHCLQTCGTGWAQSTALCTLLSCK
jgi:hypothetical protein